MSQVYVQFYSTDLLLFEEKEKASALLKNDFKCYLVTTSPHKLVFLENKNQVLCTLFTDKVDFIFQHNSKQESTLKIINSNQQAEKAIHSLIKQPVNENKEINNQKSEKSKNKKSKDEKAVVASAKDLHSGQPQQQDQKQENNQNIIIEMRTTGTLLLKNIMEDINDRKTFIKFQGPLAYNPCRMERTSLMSSESPEQNYRGFINVAVLVIIANNIRAIHDNLQQYGWLVTSVPSPVFFLVNYYNYPFIMIFLSLGFYVIFSYTIQKIYLKNMLSNSTAWLFNASNSMLNIIVPVALSRKYNLGPLSSMIIVLFSLMILLKIISYAHVIRNSKFLMDKIRKIMVEDKKNSTLSHFIDHSDGNEENLEILKTYCLNPCALIQFNDLLYLLFAPTLCFQLSYPRTPKIRWGWLLKRVIEFFAVLSLIVVLWIQILQPNLEHAYKDMSENPFTVGLMLQALLKLSIPNTYIWVSSFYLFFQVFLNITAELLRFGDRQFYLDWWNCQDMEEYWKLWNIPVHSWFIRHLYNPILRRGVSQVKANFLVFLFSAVAHEWLVSAPLGIVSFHAFTAMLTQAPIIFFQKKMIKFFRLQKSQLGNVFFWLTFCFVGQPLGIYIYYELYMNKYYRI